ncbi:hypothetical protein FCM35_KLT02490 [Carex littledalei]|uniref:Uncharacterized protein n=1 Tax=Carex littledalei TaxID=544730 RepID=A0A833R3U6_9POAL|nr:hypothetical protein FCM35_KLT02490 [Carex littledalei]
MVPLFLLSLLFLLVIGASSAHHVISINSSTLQFSSLAWDPTAHHFVAGSAMDPTVYAITDEGTVKCLLSEPSSNNSGDSVTALTVDQIRLRLIVAFSNPSSVSAYDLKSYRRIYAVPLPELDGSPGGVVVDLKSGEVFVSSARRGIVLKGLGGIVYLKHEYLIHGYILVLQTRTGKIFKVDTVDGTVNEVLSRDSSMPLAPSGHAIALQIEKFVVVATNHSVLLIKNDKNRWARAAIVNKMKMEEGKIVMALAMREGENVYVLVNSPKGYMIEEAVLGWFQGYDLWYFFLGVSLIAFYIPILVEFISSNLDES